MRLGSIRRTKEATDRAVLTGTACIEKILGTSSPSSTMAYNAICKKT